MRRQSNNWAQASEHTSQALEMFNAQNAARFYMEF